jgi:hypothetical protein
MIGQSVSRMQTSGRFHKSQDLLTSSHFIYQCFVKQTLLTVERQPLLGTKRSGRAT